MVTATRTSNRKLRKRLFDLLPDSGLRLASRGIVDLKVRSVGPSFAWTEWDKKRARFNVCFLDVVDEWDDDVLRFLWYHELGHIALGHFARERDCERFDWLVAADVSVNWALRDRKHIIQQIEGIDAEEWLPELGLGLRTYPMWVIHDILHEKVDEHIANCPDCQAAQQGGHGMPGEGDACGGIEQTDDPRAIARGLVASQELGSSEGDNWWQGIGTDPGGMGIRLTDSDLPPWVRAVEQFARAMVEVQLAERRTHKRPNPTLRSAGLHVPTARPAWTPVPAVLCLLVDTSGSMLGDLHFVAPVLTYLRQHDIRVRLIAGDTQVTFDELVETIPEDIPGAGGTDIIPLFERADEYDPKGVVCFTDGYVPAWPHEPNVPVLWVGCKTEVPYGQAA